MAMVGLALAPLPALASDARIPCSCRYAGTKFTVGTVTCLHTPKGARLARCDMVLNNTSWTFLKDGCPISRRATDENFEMPEAGDASPDHG